MSSTSSPEAGTPYGDPHTRPFWEAARRHVLTIQRCVGCGTYQFYPRPSCLACDSSRMEWVAARGIGTVYSATTVHLNVGPDFEPPYVVAIVQLDEGPRLLTNLINGSCSIGDRVRLRWKERPEAPPFPVFEKMDQ